MSPPESPFSSLDRADPSASPLKTDSTINTKHRLDQNSSVPAVQAETIIAFIQHTFFSKYSGLALIIPSFGRLLTSIANSQIFCLGNILCPKLEGQDQLFKCPKFSLFPSFQANGWREKNDPVWKQLFYARGWNCKLTLYVQFARNQWLQKCVSATVKFSVETIFTSNVSKSGLGIEFKKILRLAVRCVDLASLRR